MLPRKWWYASGPESPTAVHERHVARHLPRHLRHVLDHLTHRRQLIPVRVLHRALLISRLGVPRLERQRCRLVRRVLRIRPRPSQNVQRPFLRVVDVHVAIRRQFRERRSRARHLRRPHRVVGHRASSVTARRSRASSGRNARNAPHRSRRACTEARPRSRSASTSETHRDTTISFARSVPSSPWRAVAAPVVDGL